MNSGLADTRQCEFEIVRPISTFDFDADDLAVIPIIDGRAIEDKIVTAAHSKCLDSDIDPEDQDYKNEEYESEEYKSEEYKNEEYESEKYSRSQPAIHPKPVFHPQPVIHHHVSHLSHFPPLQNNTPSPESPSHHHQFQRVPNYHALATQKQFRPAYVRPAHDMRYNNHNQYDFEYKQSPQIREGEEKIMPEFAKGLQIQYLNHQYDAVIKRPDGQNGEMYGVLGALEVSSSYKWRFILLDNENGTVEKKPSDMIVGLVDKHDVNRRNEIFDSKRWRSQLTKKGEHDQPVLHMIYNKEFQKVDIVDATNLDPRYHVVIYSERIDTSKTYRLYVQLQDISTINVF